MYRCSAAAERPRKASGRRLDAALFSSVVAINVHEALPDGVEDGLGAIVEVKLLMSETWFRMGFSEIERSRVICLLP